MKPNYFPIHPIFQQKNLGSETWWNSIKEAGTPLIVKNTDQMHCTFLWRRQKKESVYIDVYSQSPTIYKQWNKFQQIENTDIAFFEIRLPLDWSGSYVLVTTPDIAPTSNDPQVRRSWWQSQLQQYAQVDEYNPYPAYPAQVSRWVNQLHLAKQNVLVHPQSSPTVYHTVAWDSMYLNTLYPVDFYQSAPLTETSPLIIFLDGQIWSQHLPILEKIRSCTELGLMHPASYAFLHSLNSKQRCLDYGCRDLFSQAIVEELIPYLQKSFSLSPSSPVILCGQSLGGLCALHSYLLYPDAFQGLILQSGSYWWSDYSNSPFLNGDTQRFLEVIEHYLQPSASSTQIFISAGHYETDMREDSQQLYAKLSSILPVQIHTFAGGHDAINWETDLIDTLQTLLS
ncbi:hypothetical protein F889_00751 [Acinetobacter colistiniresistens]|uniref:Enterochelin esterase N-terminal domain-containing protein n=1 Tax=Acinetobacter colistiniresistens TaxID=280145 RepID=N9R036_9GAMM|nr:alpha/beta hydrolase-fold protein [Acinetobacter colistiniresistens]ENX35676.1 hypothetical protein F889_00751 [Acinetobacter colistiniresistens]